MAQTSKLGKRATKVTDSGDVLTVTYHNTDVVTWNRRTGRITLNSNGWQTNTTKIRMNQASNQYGLGFQVSQTDYAWSVSFYGTDRKPLPFRDGMTLPGPKQTPAK